MTVRALDENDDIVTSRVQFKTEREEVAQTIKTRLHLFTEEYFRNITEGTPWFQQIMPKSTSLSTKEGFLKSRILQTPNVIRFLEFSTDYDINSRQFSVSAVVLSTFGQIVIDEQGFL
jgi:hypothetical protein